MTPASKMVYVSPSDSIENCYLIMNEVRIRNLPVIEGKTLVGVLALKDISTYEHLSEVGGKASYVQRILPRRGIPKDIKAAAVKYSGPALTLNVSERGVTNPRKTWRNPNAPSEDAYFISTQRWGKSGAHITYFGVADGVGSWAQYGVDPSAFSRRLVEAAKRRLLEASVVPDAVPPTPLQLMKLAWEDVREEEVIGSATLCVATLDNEHNLSVSISQWSCPAVTSGPLTLHSSDCQHWGLRCLGVS